MNAAYHGPVALLTHLDNKSIKKSKHIVELAKRFLEVDGGSSTDNDSSETACDAAAIRMHSLVDDLEAILDQDDVNELDLISYFKNNPAAAFLLCPDFVFSWRELELQKYGIIDFVFACPDGRFVAIEIEPPLEKVFRRDDELTSRALHAIDQVEKWVRGVRDLPALASKLIGSSNFSNIEKAVVIGRASELSNSDRKDRWFGWSNKHVKLYTWDDLVERGRNLAEKFSNPTVAVVPWS